VNSTLVFQVASFDESAKKWSTTDVQNITMDKTEVVGTGSELQIEMPAVKANKTYCLFVPAGVISSAKNANFTNKAIGGQAKDGAKSTCQFYFSTVGKDSAEPKPVMLAHYPGGAKVVAAGGFKEMHFYFNQKVALNQSQAAESDMGFIQSSKKHMIKKI
jgi:hypothetical protein